MDPTELERALSRAARRFANAVGIGDEAGAEKWARIAFSLRELQTAISEATRS